MSTLLYPKGILLIILKKDSSNIQYFSFEVRVNAIRSTIYTNCLHDFQATYLYQDWSEFLSLNTFTFMHCTI